MGHANADVESEVFFSVFSERAEVLGTVSQYVHHVVVKVRGLKRCSTGRGLNLKSIVAIGFVGNVR